MEDEFNAFIEAEGFISIGEDLFKCPEGETWHSDEIHDLMMELFAGLL